MKKIITLILSLLAFESYAADVEYCLLNTQTNTFGTCFQQLYSCEAHKGQFYTCVIRPRTQ